MKGPCSVDQFWAEVARIGWKDRNPCRFYKQVEGSLLQRWDDEFLASFRERMDEFVGELQSRIQHFEKDNGVSCECGDDGFSDLTHHIVGLGREEYEKVMADPMLAVERGRKCEYEESFSYCIPHERVVREPLTYEQALAKVRLREEAAAWGAPVDPEEDAGDKEGFIEMEALEMMLGERAQLDVRYYAAWAKRDRGDLERLAASPYADRFKDLPYVLECVAKIAAGKVTDVVDEGKKFKAAAERLREQREALHQEKINELKVLEPRGWSLDNLAGDALAYIGGVDGEG